jgi:hypothetical protein
MPVVQWGNVWHAARLDECLFDPSGSHMRS